MPFPLTFLLTLSIGSAPTSASLGNSFYLSDPPFLEVGSSLPPTQYASDGSSIFSRRSPHYCDPYKKSIDGADILQGITFFENGQSFLLVENYESGFWWISCDASNRLIFADEIEVKHMGTGILHPHGVVSGLKNSIGGTVAFSLENIRLEDERRFVADYSLYFLRLDNAGNIQSTARLLNEVLGGYAQLLPNKNNRSQIIYNVHTKKNNRAHLLIGWYNFQPIPNSPAQSLALQSTQPYDLLHNHGMQIAPDGSYVGVSCVRPVDAHKSFIWYYVLAPETSLPLKRSGYFIFSKHSLHSRGFGLSQSGALWSLLTTEKSLVTLVAEITPNDTTGQIYKLRPPKGSFNLSAISLGFLPFAPTIESEYLLLAGSTSQVDALGERALCILYYTPSFKAKWAYAYNASVLKETPVFLEKSKHAVYVAGSSDIGVFKMRLELSTGALEGHIRYPIHALLLNRTGSKWFYLTNLPAKKPFKHIPVVFRNYTATRHRKTDLGVVPAPFREKNHMNASFNPEQTMAIRMAAIVTGLFLIGGIYLLLACPKKIKRLSASLKASGATVWSVVID